MEVDSDAGSESSYEICGMALEQEYSGSDSGGENEQERKRQRLGTPGRSQSSEEIVTFEPVPDEEKEQIVQAAHNSTNFDLGRYGRTRVGSNRRSSKSSERTQVPPYPFPTDSTSSADRASATGAIGSGSTTDSSV
jgi:hypothetical protein